MHPQIPNLKKTINLNLYIFSTLYFGLVLLERQVIREGFFIFSWPFKTDFTEILGGFTLGSLLVIAGTALLRKRSWILSLVLVGGLISGVIYLNYFMFRFYYPPAAKTAPGDLDRVGELRWQHDFPYEIYAKAFELYYLQQVIANPELENFAELSRLEHFGIYLVESQDVPVSLPQQAYQGIQDRSQDFIRFQLDTGQEIQLYPPGASKQILLTSTDNILLFIPIEWLAE